MATPLPLPFEPEESENRPQKVTPRQLLDIRESEWRPHLESVSLVSESFFNAKEIGQAARALGMTFTRELDVYGRSNLRHWPACVAAVTVGVATKSYAHGTFWPALWEATGVPASRRKADVWGPEFLRSLEILGLDSFPGMTYPYVDPILMHSGIPTYCLGDVFELLLHRSTLEPGLDAYGFHLWAVSGRHRLKELDIPASRFISSGGDYALETIERCTQLLDLLREDPGAGPREVGLPDRFRAPAVASLERAADRGALPRRSLSRSFTPRTVRPRLRLDPFVHGIHVVLPVLEGTEDLDVSWEVTTDEGTRTVRSRRRWGAATEPTVFALLGPTRSVSITPQGIGAREQLDLIDPQDPLLVFDDSGALVGADATPSPGPVWVMGPSTHELTMSETVEDLGSFEVPYGWEGWFLRRLRLHRGDAIRLGDGPHHHAQGRERPRLELPEPVVGVTTPQGAPVYSRRPTVVLPEAEGAPVEWSVETRSAAEGRLIRRVRACSGESLVILEDVPSPVVGSYTVNVRGPLGRGMSRQITIIEELDARHTPRVRVLEPGGLVAGRTDLVAADGVEVEPADVRLGPQEAARPATARAGTSAASVVVEPPHLRLLATGETSPQWRVEPLRLDCESVARTGDLLVRVPEGGPSPGPLVALHGEDVVQRVEAGPVPGTNTHRYPLGQLVETALTRRHLRLVVGYESAAMPVAVVRPRRLAGGARVQDGVIELDAFAGIDDVSVAVYPRGAPWRTPVVLPVPTDGRVPLPEDLREAGPMRLLLAVEDPWSVTDHPRWPTSADPNVLDCSAQGRPTGSDEEEEQLCAVFATGDGLDSLPLSHGNAVRLWRVLSVSDQLVHSGVPRERIAACADALGNAPLPALMAHGDAEPSAAESVWSLVTGGLVASPAGGRVPVRQAAELWHRLPAAAALATSDLLPLIDAEVPDLDHAELMEQLERRCGEIAMTLLRGEADPASSAGRFDAGSEHLARMPKDRFAAIWQAARIVPRALLDEDSRTQAALGLFSVRDRPEMHRVRAAAREIAGGVLHLAKRLDQTYRRPVLDLLEPRHAPGASRWRDLPAASLALALSARLAARGVPSFISLSRGQRAVWGDLARHAPDLVRIDIVLAELALAGAERAHFAKERNR